jgi:hypothetical protein
MVLLKKQGVGYCVGLCKQPRSCKGLGGNGLGCVDKQYRSLMQRYQKP